MGLAQIIEVYCDRDGCEETFATTGVGRIEARRQAASEGWTRTPKHGSAPRGDLCPKHSGGTTRTLPCSICGEPMEVPARARKASHGGRCPRFIAERSEQLQEQLREQDQLPDSKIRTKNFPSTAFHGIPIPEFTGEEVRR